MWLLEENDHNSSQQGGPGMASIVDGSVKIQTTPESNISTPAWFGEVVVISTYLRTQGVFKKINEQVRFARKRFGQYEVIDFLAVLFGYALSSTLSNR
jgi:hypothetical protein